ARTSASRRPSLDWTGRSPAERTGSRARCRRRGRSAASTRRGRRAPRTWSWESSPRSRWSVRRRARALEAREALDVLLELACHRDGDRRAHLRDRGQEVRSGGGSVTDRERALERRLRGLVSRELDVRGGEELRALGKLADVDFALGDLRDVALPDARTRRSIGRPDR